MTKFDTSRRGFLGIAGGIAGAGLMSATLPRMSWAQGAAAPLNFGFQNTSWGTIGMIAEAEDLFTKAGGKVSVNRFDAGKAVRDAMVAGRLDIGVLGATPFIVGAAKGDIIGIGMGMYAGQTLAIVVGENSGITKAEDLKGKRIASQLGSATDSVFQRKILPAFNMTGEDVQVINVPFSNHISALASGSVDGFAGVEPFPSVAEVNKLGKTLLDYSKYDITPVIIAADSGYVKENRAAVVAFLRGWLAGVDIFNDDPARAEAIVKAHFAGQGFEITDEIVKTMLGKLDVRPEFIPELNTALTEEAENLVKAGQLEAVPDWSKLLDTSLLEEARKSA